MRFSLIIGPHQSGVPRIRVRCPGVLLAMYLLTAGCEWQGGEYPTTPDAQHLVIHGMLSAVQERQEILVERTRSMDEGYYRGATPATDVEVRVEGPDGIHHFHEDPSGSGVYSTRFSLRPGERYTLRVRKPGGGLVSSSTVVPVTPRLISPRTDTTIALGDYVTVQWTSSPPAAGYVLLDTPPGEPTSVGALVHPGILGEASVTAQWGKNGRRVFHVRIAAVDSNFVRYSAEVGGEGRGTGSTVSGGYGLFGSYGVSGTRVISIR